MNREAGGSPWVSRRESGTCARREKTRDQSTTWDRSMRVCCIPKAGHSPPQNRAFDRRRDANACVLAHRPSENQMGLRSRAIDVHATGSTKCLHSPVEQIDR